LSETVQPIYLLADSQLLFWRDGEGRLLLDRARRALAERAGDRPFRAVYLGAANGDLPEFYELFVAAMAEAGIAKTRHIPARPSADDLEALDLADLILLAGGDTRAGWRAFQEAGLPERLTARYHAGAVLVGISAGAIQLGLQGWDEGTESAFDTLRLVPFLIDAHGEPEWPTLHRLVRRAGDLGRGYGIPAGGGALYHPDYSLEPVRHPVTELEQRDGDLRQSLVLPGTGDEGAAEAPRILSEREAVEAALRDLGAGPEPAAGAPPEETVH